MAACPSALRRAAEEEDSQAMNLMVVWAVEVAVAVTVEPAPIAMERVAAHSNCPRAPTPLVADSARDRAAPQDRGTPPPLEGGSGGGPDADSEANKIRALAEELAKVSKKGKEADEIKLQPLPDAASRFRAWRLAARAQVVSASGKGLLCFNWIMDTESSLGKSSVIPVNCSNSLTSSSKHPLYALLMAK